MIQLNQHYFEVIENHKDAFNQEMFEGRYSEILDRYPYIVGDIGFEQLRLKGFFDDRKKGTDVSKRFSSIQDYLLEYCNFGCAYFILRRLSEHEIVKLIQPETIDTIESTETVEMAEKEAIEEPELSFAEPIEEVQLARHDFEQVEEQDTPSPQQPVITHNKTLKDFLK
ncbi:YutD family protein [Macrococcus capreoli]